MGDRGNIKIKESTGISLYLYTHWGGSDLPQTLQAALRFAESRWNDESYLQRCIVTKACEGEDSATGYGLSTYPTDNEHDVLEVDSAANKVRLLSCDGWHDGGSNWEKNKRVVLGEWTFKDYIGLDLSKGFDSLPKAELAGRDNQS